MLVADLRETISQTKFCAPEARTRRTSIYFHDTYLKLYLKLLNRISNHLY